MFTKLTIAATILSAQQFALYSMGIKEMKEMANLSLDPTSNVLSACASDLQGLNLDKIRVIIGLLSDPNIAVSAQQKIVHYSPSAQHNLEFLLTVSKLHQIKNTETFYLNRLNELCKKSNIFTLLTDAVILGKK